MILVDDHDRGAVRDALEKALRRQAEMTSALRAFSTSYGPPDLSDAPFLRSWVVAGTAVPCLVGLTDNHPLLNGPTVMTSPVLLLSRVGGWARTESRWYRLGSRAGELQ